MNLFVTDTDPVKCAQALDDTRLIKMAVESTQMLVSALFLNGVPKEMMPHNKAGEPYSPGWLRHPLVPWTARTKGNYEWHLNHLKALCAEYEYRMERTHHCAQAIPFFEEMYLLVVPDGPLDPFCNSSLFKDDGDVLDAYRRTMNHKWTNDKIKVRWTKRQPPQWSTIDTVLLCGTHEKLTDKLRKQMELIAQIDQLVD